MKKFLIVICIFLFYFSPSYSDYIKFGYVDMSRIFEEYSSAKQAKLILQSELEEKEKDLEKLKKEIEKQKEDFATKKIFLDEKAEQSFKNEIEQKTKNYEKIAQGYYAEISQKEEKFVKQIKEEIALVIKKIGEQEEYGLIFNKDETKILYAGPKIDLTDKIIQILNQQEEQKENNELQENSNEEKNNETQGN
ncbi:MAG: OmpH family outer membrane protein [bacterium]